MSWHVFRRCILHSPLVISIDQVVSSYTKDDMGMHTRIWIHNRHRRAILPLNNNRFIFRNNSSHVFLFYGTRRCHLWWANAICEHSLHCRALVKHRVDFGFLGLGGTHVNHMGIGNSLHVLWDCTVLVKIIGWKELWHEPGSATAGMTTWTLDITWSSRLLIAVMNFCITQRINLRAFGW